MSEKDKNAEVYYNGVEADDVAVSKGNTVKVSSSSANNKLVADGSTVEVFYDEDNNDVTICIIDTYVGTISSKEEKVSDPYEMCIRDSHNGIGSGELPAHTGQLPGELADVVNPLEPVALVIHAPDVDLSLIHI